MNIKIFLFIIIILFYIPNSNLVAQNNGQVCVDDICADDLPEYIYFKTHIDSFNRRYYISLRNGRLWIKPNKEITGIDESWTLLGPNGLPFERFKKTNFTWLNGIKEFSLDGRLLVAISESNKMYNLSNCLDDMDKFYWENKWGAPFGKGSGLYIPVSEIINWSSSIDDFKEEGYYEDLDQNKNWVLVGTVFLLKKNGKSIHFADTKPGENNTKAIIVTVDGLSLEKSNDYLLTNLEKLINSGFIRSFTWSGKAGDTAAILASPNSGLRKFFQVNYQEAKESHKAFIVVSHSWGTYLSYLALSLEPQIQCDLFITLSSPLGTTSGLPASIEKMVRDYTDAKLTKMAFNILGTKYPQTKLFYNFWANGDLISGSLSGKIPAGPLVYDVRVDYGVTVDREDINNCFFWHKFTTLGDEVITDPSYMIYTGWSGILNILAIRNNFLNQVVTLIQTASGYRN